MSGRFSRSVSQVLCLILLSLAGSSCALDNATTKNVILMISDGAGFNAFQACSYYQHGRLGLQVYDDFPVRIACSTGMLNPDGSPQGYDPDRAWNDFNYVKGDDNYHVFTDSAAAATALYTGVKTTRGRISTRIDNQWLTSVAQAVDQNGKSTGIVTSVQISHATPACVWAHNEARGHYQQIAREMIYESGLNVIMGTGHPHFDNNGQPVAPGTQDSKYVGGETCWQEIISGDTGQDWTFIETRADFEALARNPSQVPDRLLGIAQVYKTLQYNRDGSGMGKLNVNVPSLATMTRGALNVLSRNPRGFFLMVEGGAVDWANHDNKMERMIEEQSDFNRSVEAVVDWIEENGGWQENLLIVTSDHECGMLWGPGSYLDRNLDGDYDVEADTFVDWNPILNNGAGKLPGYQYASDGHTNALVPLYAKGKGAVRFYWTPDGIDPAAQRHWGFNGLYVDNTDFYSVMSGRRPPKD